MSWSFVCAAGAGRGGGHPAGRGAGKGNAQNDEPQQKIDTADDFVRAVTPVLQSETDLLAEQLRAMQGESARTTTATLRDFSAVLAENQRQNAAASTARLESIDRAGPPARRPRTMPCWPN